MDQSEIETLVPGAREVVELYGDWPSFPDAEVVCLELNRLGRSRIQVHAFAMTDEVDGRGYYVIKTRSREFLAGGRFLFATRGFQ